MKRLVVIMLAMILLAPAFGSSIWAQTEKPLTTKQAMKLLSTAKTPEEHDRLAQYFNQKAAKLDADAKEHEEWSNLYHKGKAPLMQNAEVCDKAAADERKAAQENRAIAESHHKEAEDLRTSAPH
jgi:hypothetical protein